MPPIEELFQQAQARYQRFEQFFRLGHELETLIDQVLAGVGGGFAFKRGRGEDVSIIAGASFFKGLRTFKAAKTLALFGFGTEALLLIRSNINLLINVDWILSSDNPTEAAEQFVAYSYLENRKFGRGIGLHTQPESEEDKSIRDKAAAWGKLTIAKRAERSREFHYKVGYRQYSAVDHSDSSGLIRYIRAWKRNEIEVDYDPSDEDVILALEHNIAVMADLLVSTCDFFKVPTGDLRNRIWALTEQLAEADKLARKDGQ